MKKKISFLFCLGILLVTVPLTTCRKDKVAPDYNGYPKEIGEILVNKCVTPACHNTLGKDACAGLDLSSWESLFRGTRNNSCIIPYRPDQSFLLFSVNTFNDLGPTLPPSMPLYQHPLSREEVITLRNWIAAGAPDNKGFIKWSDNPNRSKVYVANQGCDFITVFDAKSKLAMRIIDVGNNPVTESPHDMFVSPDGQYLYVSFYLNSIFQKFRTSDGTLVGELNLGELSWHSMSISGDSRYALVSHLDGNGKVALINLSTMQLVVMYQGSGFLIYPHGCAMNYNGTLAYITSQQSNFIYKMDLSDPFNPVVNKLPLRPGDIPNNNGIYKPYTVSFSPDYSKYYVTCQGTSEVRIYNSLTDSIIRIIPTTGVPQLVSFSEYTPFAYVTCMEDTANVTTSSSVNIINTNINQVAGTVYTGYQPRGLVVDDANRCVWIANRNIFGTGWAPHHTTSCQGRDGYVTLIDMNTQQLNPGWKTEVSVDPYCVTIKK